VAGSLVWPVRLSSTLLEITIFGINGDRYGEGEGGGWGGAGCTDSYHQSIAFSIEKNIFKIIPVSYNSIDVTATSLG
jgi:hypothetical protein